MTDDDKSLGDQHTFDGETPGKVDAAADSLGDEMTYAGGANVGPSSLGDEMTFSGVAEGLDDDLVDGDMEIVDLDARYTTEGVLGKGGMGEVLLATDTRLERKVAIKRILGKAARSRTAVKRFLTEAKSVAAINHPNIVQIYDYGRAKDGPFLIMECVEGNSLLDRCRQGAIPLDESIDLVVQLCDGLAAAHDAHIIHRDIKPANILLTKSNIPKLTDFGLAKAEAADTGMTMAGAVLGTLDFMPPEQRKDAALVDQRSDLWSLAATLYQMVTGKSPKIIKFTDVPSSLHAVLGKALEDEKDDRYQSARDFKDALLASRSGAAEVELAEGDCPHCGTKNPTNRKFCRNPDCGESLEVPCLSCQTGIPLWEQVCDSCGETQEIHLANRKETMGELKQQAEQLLQKSEFDKALEIANEIGNESDLRLQHLKPWSEDFSIREKASRMAETKRSIGLIDQAKGVLRDKNYAESQHILEQIPSALWNKKLPGHEKTPLDMLEIVKKRIKLIERLKHQIEQGLSRNQFDGLLQKVETLIKLTPYQLELEKIHNKVKEHEKELATEAQNSFKRASKLFMEHDYEGCISETTQVKPSFRNDSIVELETKAGKCLTEITRLRNLIALSTDKTLVEDILANVTKCLALSPNAEDLKALQKQLQKKIQANNPRSREIIEQAKLFWSNCQFHEAILTLAPMPKCHHDKFFFDLFHDCKRLAGQQKAAIRTLDATLTKKQFNEPYSIIQEYSNSLNAKGLNDIEFSNKSKKVKTARTINALSDTATGAKTKASELVATSSRTLGIHTYPWPIQIMLFAILAIFIIGLLCLIYYFFSQFWI